MPQQRVGADGPAAVLLVQVSSGTVVHANGLARQLAPGVTLPVDVDAWSDAAGLRDDEGEGLSGTEHPLSSAARGEPVSGRVVSARRSSDASAAREPLSVFGLPLEEAQGLQDHTLVVLLPIRATDAVQQAEEAVATQRLVRDRALLATPLSFTLASATTPDHPLEWVNPAFTATTGYSVAESVGRNCRFLQGPDTDLDEVQRVREAIEAGRDVTTVLLNYRRDGTAFWNQVTITPVVDAGGVLTHFVGVQSDVTERVETERVREAALAEARAARDEAQQMAARLSLLARASEVLAQTLDVRDALERLVDIAVPELADWAIASVAEDGALTQVTAKHRDGHEDLLRRWAELQPTAITEGSATLRALRTRQPVLQPDLDVERVRAQGAVSGAGAAESLALFERLGLTSALVVPLVARDDVVGTLALLTGDGDRRFGQADVDTATDLARRAALALDNSRLYTQAHTTALTLQRSLLPKLPTIPGLELASAYLPSARAAQVGGDWWDAFALPHEPGRPTALAVGDVMGHDVEAASAMGQLRSVLRTCAWLGDAPSVVLSRLDRLVQSFAMAQLATCIYARLELSAGADSPARLRWSSAGHLPPVLQHPDGRVRLLQAPAGLPIGVADDEQRHDECVTLEAGSTVLLYTDGLVETPGGDIDDDLQGLLSAVARHRPADGATALVERLLRTHTPHGDDVAILAVRLL